MPDVLVAGYEWSSQVSVAYSDDGTDWAWMQVPNNWTTEGNQQTSASVGLAYFNNAIWCAFRGVSTTNLYVISSSTWKHGDTGKSTVVGPAMTVFNDRLRIAFISEATGHIEVISSSAGESWDGWANTRQSSRVAPAMAVFDEKLWIAYIDQDTNRVKVMWSNDGTAWNPMPPTSQSSRVAPAMAVFDKKLWVAYIDQDTNRLEMIASADGKTWPIRVVPGQKSKLSPSLTVFRNALWAASVDASGLVPELISSRDGHSWEQHATRIPWLPATTGLTMITVPAAPSGPLVGGNQYVFSAPGNAPLPPLLDFQMQIFIYENLTFGADKPLSFQLNCCAGVVTTGRPPRQKITWQQYCLTMQPNSTQMILHVQNFGPGSVVDGVIQPDPSDLDPDNIIAMIAPNSDSQINFPSVGVIPAGWQFLMSLQYLGNKVSGAKCHVYDNTGAEVLGSPLTVKLPGQTGTQAFPADPTAVIDESWLEPIVMGQLVVVGYAGGNHATLTGGTGQIALSCTPALIPGDSWNNSACQQAGGGTAETSNCVYSHVPNAQNATLLQRFGAPPSA
jgi:hypothetical protein